MAEKEHIDVMAFTAAYLKDNGWDDGTAKLIRFSQSTRSNRYAITIEFETSIYRGSGRLSRAIEWLEEQRAKPQA